MDISDNRFFHRLKMISVDQIYRLTLVKEVNKLPIDGWVISEPLLGWEDIYDDYYTDFSAPTVNKFKASFGVDPNLIIDQASPHYFEYDWPNYQAWTGFLLCLSHDGQRKMGCVEKGMGIAYLPIPL